MVRFVTVFFVCPADLWELPFKYFGTLWLDFLEIVLQNLVWYLSDMEGKEEGKKKRKKANKGTNIQRRVKDLGKKIREEN